MHELVINIINHRFQSLEVWISLQETTNCIVKINVFSIFPSVND